MCNFDAIFCQIKFYIVYAWSWYDRSVYFAFLYEADNSPARIIGMVIPFPVYSCLKATRPTDLFMDTGAWLNCPS